MQRASTLQSAKTIVCKYLAYKLSPSAKSKFVRLPLVHVYLKSDNGTDLYTSALVDSGSTSTFLPAELASILGLKNLVDSSAVGAGGSFPTSLSKLALLQIWKGVPFDSFRDVVVNIPQNIGAIPYMVLGRDTIFKHFDITFHENRLKIKFSRL